MHYYQHHIGDFIKATARLTDAQSMAYLRLLWMYYDSERPLPDNIESLAFQIGTDEQTVRLILSAYFKFDEGTWKHTRCDAEISEYRDILNKRSNAGRASAERRMNKRSTSVQQESSNDAADVQLTNNHKPETINHEPDTSTNRRSNTRKRVDRPDDVTESVWEAWVDLRNSKRNPVSVVAVNKIRAEASRANLSLDAALELCCARGWQGFNAQWVEKRDKKEAAMDFLLGRTDADGNRIVEPAPWEIDDAKRIL